MSEGHPKDKARGNLSTDMLAYIGKYGRSFGFPAPRLERLAFVKAAMMQGLIAWNKSLGKYELTTRGHQRLAGDNIRENIHGNAARTTKAF